MAQSEPTADVDDTGADGQPLRAQLAIEPHSAADCAVLEQDVSTTEITQQLKVDPDSQCRSDAESGCGECHSELVVDGNDERSAEYLTSEISGDCICPIFAANDCISQIKAVRGRELIVGVTVQDRSTLRDVMAGLNAVEASVTVEWLVRGDSSAVTTEIDASSITEKQQTAMETAIEMGYYERPRRTDLTSIADELDISESAVSQRLNSAETKLVKAYLKDIDNR